MLPFREGQSISDRRGGLKRTVTGNETQQQSEAEYILTLLSFAFPGVPLT
jgi:hypothetical protein